MPPLYQRHNPAKVIDSPPVRLGRRSIDTRPVSRGEPPGRWSWPNARGWPELRERSVDWSELHPDDRVVPVPGEVDPATHLD